MGLLLAIERLLKNTLARVAREVGWWLMQSMIFAVTFGLTLVSGSEALDYDRIILTRWPNWFTNLHPVFLAGTAITALVTSRVWPRFSFGHLVVAAGMAMAQALLLANDPNKAPAAIASYVVYVLILFISLRRPPAALATSPPT